MFRQSLPACGGAPFTQGSLLGQCAFEPLLFSRRENIPKKGGGWGSNADLASSSRRKYFSVFPAGKHIQEDGSPAVFYGGAVLSALSVGFAAISPKGRAMGYGRPAPLHSSLLPITSHRRVGLDKYLFPPYTLSFSSKSPGASGPHLAASLPEALFRL